MDALKGVWITLEWLHAETGIAYGLNKPLLILKDRKVTLRSSLPGYLAKSERVPIIEFDPYNLEELRNKLSAVMPKFREWIESKKRQEYTAKHDQNLNNMLSILNDVNIYRSNYNCPSKGDRYNSN